MSQNLNHVLEEGQRRQPQGQVTPARIPPGRTDRVCRPGPRVRQPRYSRSGFSDSNEESVMYSTHRQSFYRHPAQQSKFFLMVCMMRKCGFRLSSRGYQKVRALKL